MRIFFIGSFSKSKGRSGNLVPIAACDLGYECANRRWGVIVGSDTENTADHYVIDGVLRSAKENTSISNLQIEIHRPRDPDNPSYFLQRDIPENVRIYYNFYDNETPWQDGQHTSRTAKEKYLWAGAHAAAISASDAMITLGGRLHTQRAADLAKAIGIPVVPIGISGGQSEILFESERSGFTDIIKRQPSLDYSQGEWSADIASIVLDFVVASTQRSLGARSEPASMTGGVQGHTYFLSYSKENKLECDQIELLLRRENRKVLRDESDIPLGSQLDSRIRNLIASCDTFVALLSNSYRGSPWCMAEFECAHSLSSIRKVIVLVGSDSATDGLTTTWAHGKSWDQKRLAVSDLIRGEQSRDV